MTLPLFHRSQEISPVATPLWRINSCLNGPRTALAAYQSIPQQVFRHPSCATQVSKGVPRPAVFEDRVGDSIVRLFSSRSPATVARPVISIVIFAVDRVTWRPLAHVCEEIAEITPASADRNATCSIVRKCRVRRLRAASDHVLPRSICRCSIRLATLARVAMLRNACH